MRPRSILAIASMMGLLQARGLDLGPDISELRRKDEPEPEIEPEPAPEIYTREGPE